VRFSPTPEASLLELIESILTGHATIIKSHPEQAHLVRSILLPHLIKTFSERTAFPIALRVTRLLYLVVKNHIDQFPAETETILQWFNHNLDPEATLLWKRILCMEVFREIFNDSNLVLRIHDKFDGREGRNSVIPNCLTAFVRLATEKPALIGLSQQSTVPIGHYFQRDAGPDASADPAVTPGPSGGAAGVPTSAVPGISAQFSSVRTPCIEQLDKTEPPNAPETYIYSLVLASLNNLAESLAKFILPLTVHSGEKVKKRTKPGALEIDNKSADKTSDVSHQDPSDSEFQRSRSLKKRTVPVNPLTLSNHPSFAYIQSAADLIDKSWHAILASCSTLFYAALDSENYRSLVRSFQKFTQVAGLLSMTTPRDAFLTTLGKSAMPPNLLTAVIPSAGSQTPQTPSFLSNAKGLLSVDSIVNQATSFLPDRRRASIDSGEPTLNVRNLLCLRALLNLAIALGPTLENSWSIIIETLQLADKALAGTGGRPPSRDPRSSTLPLAQSSSTEGSYAQQMSSEIAAVQSAGSRLFESTADFPNEAFVHVLKALCSLVDDKNVPPGGSGPVPPPPPGHQRRIASFSGLSIKTGLQEHDYLFTLSKVRELASLNLERFLENEPAESGWDTVMTEMIGIATKTSVSSTARLLAVDLIRHLVLDTISFPFEADEERESGVQKRALKVLTTISSILQDDGSKAGAHGLDETNIEVHEIVIETLRGLLEHSGESLTSGWPAVFEVISSVFRSSLSPARDSQGHEASSQASLLSVVLGRSAFNSIQLVCSDFLTPMLDSSLPALTELLFQFGSQEQDLNISLTVCICKFEMSSTVAWLI
jgi:Guanine nucleotide exchange factor in Golgi transport N-terminal